MQFWDEKWITLTVEVAPPSLPPSQGWVEREEKEGATEVTGHQSPLVTKPALSEDTHPLPFNSVAVAPGRSAQAVLLSFPAFAQLSNKRLSLIF